MISKNTNKNVATRKLSVAHIRKNALVEDVEYDRCGDGEVEIWVHLKPGLVHCGLYGSFSAFGSRLSAIEEILDELENHVSEGVAQ